MEGKHLVSEKVRVLKELGVPNLLLDNRNRGDTNYGYSKKKAKQCSEWKKKNKSIVRMQTYINKSIGVFLPKKVILNNWYKLAQYKNLLSPRKFKEYLDYENNLIKEK